MHLQGGGGGDDHDDAIDDNNYQWDSYCFSQLEWWCQAAAIHRQVVNPAETAPAFVRSPSVRNAP
jgi:hypothetical protein